ncbi:MAG: hypothetical protein V1859_01165 [archaeon]
MGSYDTDIILACEYAKLLIINNEGVETIAYEFSKRKLGRVSLLFKKVISDEKKGIPVAQSLDKLSEDKNTESRMKLLISSINSGKNGLSKMTEISKDIVRQNEIIAKKQIERIEFLSNWLVIIALSPIIIVVIDLFNKTMGNSPSTDIVNLSSLVIPEMLKPILLGIGTIIICSVLIILGLTKK